MFSRKKKVGKLIDYSIQYIALTEGKDMTAFHTEIAYAVHMSPSSLYNWRKGRLPRRQKVIDEYVPRFAEVFIRYDPVHHDERWVKDFYEKANYIG